MNEPYATAAILAAIGLLLVRASLASPISRLGVPILLVFLGLGMLAGSDLRTLGLPEGCLVTLIERGRDVVGPKGSTRLEPGAHACVYVLPAERTLLDLLFGGAED